MKVGIITFHFVYNCGASLQCLALQRVLKDMGHTPIVINYKPWYMQNKYTHCKNPAEYYRQALSRDSNNSKKDAVRAYWDATKTWKYFFKAKVNDDKFRVFRNETLNLTKTYRNIRSLRANPPKCDIYISGSDQLWNPYLTNGKPDPAYFLDFGKKDVGRMTYAIGSDLNELEKHKEELENLLKVINRVSLRENKCLPFLKSISSDKMDFHIDLDPTLLLEKKNYEPFESKKINMTEPFILMYTMPDSSADATRFAAREFGKRKGMPVIDIAMRRVKKDDEMLDPHVAGPDEFLAYMQQAAYVYTNSFHGTAFSVIYKKQFMAVPHRKTGNRVIELLDKLGLQDRWRKTGGETLDAMDNQIDYNSVDKKKSLLCNESISFINNTISEI